VSVRACNVGLTLCCAFLVWAVADYRHPTFYVAAVATGWFLRMTIEEW
jgi:hypothetical protein